MSTGKKTQAGEPPKPASGHRVEPVTHWQAPLVQNWSAAVLQTMPVTQQLLSSEIMLGLHDEGGFPVFGPVTGGAGAGPPPPDDGPKSTPIRISRMTTKAASRKMIMKASRKLSPGVIPRPANPLLPSPRLYAFTKPRVLGQTG